MKTRIVAVLVGFLLLFIGCSGDTGSQVPDELIGSWRTNEEKYSDSYFEIQKDTLKFGSGEDFVSPHSITKIVLQNRGPNLNCVIFYNSEGNAYEWSLVYNSIDDTIHFNNQPDIKWKRE